jgi:hypothetical protein
MEAAKWRDRPHLVVTQGLFQKSLVGKVRADQRLAVNQGRGRSGRQIVIDNDAIAGLAQLPDHMAADIARPA